MTEEDFELPMDKAAIARVEALGHIGWRPFAYEAIAGAIIITGAIPRIVSKGKTKGQLNFKGRTRIKTAVVAGDNLEAAVLLHELVKEHEEFKADNSFSDNEPSPLTCAWNKARNFLKEFK